jgi:hypothetical protein
MAMDTCLVYFHMDLQFIFCIHVCKVSVECNEQLSSSIWFPSTPLMGYSLCISAIADTPLTSHVRGHILEKYFPHPMQSCREGLFPFPYADLSSMLLNSRDKNINFSTCTHLAPYTTNVYAGFSTTTSIHWDLCQKIKMKCWVSTSRWEISDPWPSIYWKNSDSAFQLHFEGYKEANSELWKRRKKSTLREKLLWRNYLLHIESASLCHLSLNIVFNPQSLPLLMENPIISLI